MTTALDDILIDALREIQRATMRSNSLEGRYAYRLSTQAIAKHNAGEADDRIDDADLYSRQARIAEQHLRDLAPERRAMLYAEWEG